MDIIYHRNCLDGAFSSYIIYLLSRLINQEELSQFQEDMIELKTKGITNFAKYNKNIPLIQEKKMMIKNIVKLDQQFFHSKRGVPSSAYSFFAGQFYPLKFPNNSQILFILDTNLVTAENILKICQNHRLVVLIDHHTSFKQIQEQLNSLQIKNLLYVFDESRCASKLAFDFVDGYFDMKERLEQKYVNDLLKQLSYVQANDLKRGQSRASKSFVLGFYYFSIEMSHLNPNLYKRIGMLDLSYLLQKGKNLYQDHLQEIAKEVAHSKVIQFNMNGQFKGKQCFYLQPRNPSKISDIGTVLAYLSSSEGFLNLAILAMKKDYEIRVSCRSFRQKGEAMALQLSKMFQGGGHTEAAGFKIGTNEFRSKFKILSASSVATNFNINSELVERVFFGENNKQIQESVQF